MFAVQRVEAINKGEGDEFMSSLPAEAVSSAAAAVGASAGASSGAGAESVEGAIETLILGELNDYQKVILSVGSIVQDYDTDKKFPLMGFGARLRGPSGIYRS